MIYLIFHLRGSNVFSILYLVGNFALSILFASATIIRKRGEEWYSPISNSEKMIESIINISILLVLLTTVSKYLIENLILFLILLGLIFIITIVVIALNKFNKKNDNSSFDNQLVPQKESSKPNFQTKTLRDLLTRFITVFNSVCFILSIIHICFIAKYGNKSFDFFGDLDTTIKPIFEKNSTLIVSFTILIWTSLIGAIISLLGWTFSNKAIISNKKHKVNYSFFEERVMSRNKK